MLSFTVKAMNVTLGPDGLFKSALAFGEYVSVRTVSKPLQENPTLSSRAEVAMAARKKMSRIMAKHCVERRLRHNVSISSDHSFQPVDCALVWREKIHANRIANG